MNEWGILARVTQNDASDKLIWIYEMNVSAKRLLILMETGFQKEIKSKAFLIRRMSLPSGSIRTATTSNRARTSVNLFS